MQVPADPRGYRFQATSEYGARLIRPLFVYPKRCD